MELHRLTGSFLMHRPSATSLFFSSVAIAILSQVFLRKPQNNLVPVLPVCHIKCRISEILEK